MALDNFTGQRIQETYQRLVQTENGEFADGLGNSIDIVVASETASFAHKTEISGAFFAPSASISSRLSILEATEDHIHNGTYSSSLQTLGNITSSGNISASGTATFNALVASGLTYPTADGDANQIIITDGAGNLTFSNNSSEATHIEVKNETSETITKGTPVYITGNVGGSTRLTIDVADASDPAKMPAVGLLESTLGPNEEGFVAQGGYLRGLATATIDGTPTTSNVV
jgi:hypothetical protein